MGKKLTTAGFIERAIKVHGDKYDYSRVEYVNNKQAVSIICPKHGDFTQIPNDHLQGCGCQKCGKSNMAIAKIKKSQKKFYEYCHQRNDGYDYSKVVFKGVHTKVTIICPKHGEFKQTPHQHMIGSGCQKCVPNYKKTTADFIERARKVHGDKYDYSMVEYVNSASQLTITCRVHGDFTQKASDHLQGCGCQKCFGNKIPSTEEFITRSKKIHGNKYDYSKTKYTKGQEKVTIICPKHGEFKQKAVSHSVVGMGCQKCAIDQIKVKLALTTKEFIKRAKRAHGDKYDYSQVNYINSQTPVKIICKKHGAFMQKPNGHLGGHGCTNCTASYSYMEVELLTFIKNLMGNENVIHSDKTLIAPFELDVVIPSLKIAFEFNGIYWHSELHGKDKDYHANKTKLCQKAGYRLIHIWEDDWVNKNARVKSFIRHTLNKSLMSNKIYARKCDIREITKIDAEPFLNEHHIQGYSIGTVHIGLYHDNTLVAVTTFRKGHKNTKNKGSFELIRHATSGTVIGALGKAVKYFAKNHCQKIFTYCDISMFDGKSYEKAGFIKTGELKPDYQYIVNKKREHKFNWRLKRIYTEYPECEGMTEKDAMDYLGFPRVWDCGKVRYEYKINTKDIK